MEKQEGVRKIKPSGRHKRGERLLDRGEYRGRDERECETTYIQAEGGFYFLSLFFFFF